MAYGDSGEILNSFRFHITTSTYNWGPFLVGDTTLINGKYPVNQGVDHTSVWAFEPTPVDCIYSPTLATASSTHGLPDAGIESPGAANSLLMINTEIYVKAQLFIVNTVTNTAGATLTIPTTGLNTTDGATINVPFATWWPLQATGQQHKIVLRAYVAHFKYRKGCWSGGNYAARVNETTSVGPVPTSPGTYDWERGWINDDDPIVATWVTSQVLQSVAGANPRNYSTSSISIPATLEAILPEHPVSGIATNVIVDPVFSCLSDLKVNVRWNTEIIDGSYSHTLGLKSDRTVVAVGNNFSGQCNVSGWTNVRAVAAAPSCSLGLKSNNRLVTAGISGCDGQPHNVSEWTNIVAIALQQYAAFGVKSDGTVLVEGCVSPDYGQLNVSGWTNIVAVKVSARHSLGLKSNRTVVAVGLNDSGQCNVSGWTNIVEIATGPYFSLGLKSNGTVEAVGLNNYGQLNVSGWTNIIAIAAGDSHSLGLKSDGTVVAVGLNGDGQCNVSSWTNIIAIGIGDYYSLGVKSDGTVVAVGSNYIGQIDVGSWDLF